MTDEVVAETDREKEIEKQARRIQQLRDTNAGLAREIESFGGGVELGIARLEALVSYLVSQGFLTHEQQLEEAEAWERNLRPQLIQVRDKLKEMIRKNQLRSPTPSVGSNNAEKNKPGLIIPGGKTVGKKDS